ncbi:hypothetical protein [Paenibacillus aceti]|uniref:Uncharacterized protein n=1 Tax=Paenibacillus aceti TaxID=1820010 RepID=A0ABQ1VQ84_9BACL|nr:hypothetical protein [Paenibacillus aceti]GGF86118.1 hypothetical protein GCM10010913_04410 [Paenibacillus aceti]
MGFEFAIEPLNYIAFEDEAEQIEQCKEWGLLSGKAAKTKTYFYKGNGLNMSCKIVGMVDKITAVIELENQQLHCIHPSYLKEMQAASYGQRSAVEGIVTPIDNPEDSIQDTDPEIISSGAKDVEAIKATSEGKPTQADEPIVDISDPDYASQAPQGKVKGAKKQKLELPEGKVKMTATVQDFTTVPNHFSDKDDEVVIYEAVSVLEPELEIGEAWSSHSATLKKFELAVGDTITFEAKIIAKKLTKHPVAYKINNPAKIQKVNP